MADNADTDVRAGTGSGSESDLIEITQVRSVIGAQRAQRRTLRALGLRRIRQTVSQPNRPEIRGMLARVAHLIEVRHPGGDQPLDLEPGQEPRSADHDAEPVSAPDKKDKK